MLQRNDDSRGLAGPQTSIATRSMLVNRSTLQPTFVILHLWVVFDESDLKLLSCAKPEIFPFYLTAVSAPSHHPLCSVSAPYLLKFNTALTLLSNDASSLSKILNNFSC